MVVRLLFLSLVLSCASGFTVHQFVKSSDQASRYRMSKALSDLHRNRRQFAKTNLRMSGGDGDEKPTIGFLGMGIMGVPMALNLLKAGFKVTVWNRSADRCNECIQAGASAGKSPAEVHFCSKLIICPV
jgi:glutamyl-tRNA reductase